MSIELPKFRRIEDMQRFLDDMRNEINVSTQLVDSQQSLLASLVSPSKAKTMLKAIAIFEVTPSKSSVSRKLKKKIDPSLKKVVVPDLDRLKDQYGLAEDLHSKRTTLESAATQIEMQFPDRRGPAYNKAIGSINELLHLVDEQLKKVLTFLSSVANQHVPQDFQDYVAAVQEKISEHVYYEDSSNYLYVAVRDKKDIVFTEYMLLIDAVSDDGSIAPQLYVAVQWVVGGTVSVFVEHEFTLPNQLAGGSEASNVQEAVAAIASMLDIEGFASYLGALPMSLQLRVVPELLKPSLFSEKDFISKIIPEDSKLTFVLRNVNANKDFKKEVGLRLYPQVKKLFKNAKAKIKMDISKPNKIIFTLANAAGANDVSTEDVEFMREKYGLTDSAVRKIAQIING